MKIFGKTFDRFDLVYWGVVLGLMGVAASYFYRHSHDLAYVRQTQCRIQNGITRQQFNAPLAVPTLGERHEAPFPKPIHHLLFDDGRACRFTEVVSPHDERAYSRVCVDDIRQLR